jgi:hypothetical protein
VLDVRYEQYVKCQINENRKKLEENPCIHWATEKEMKILTAYIKNNMGVVEFGMCHGVRNGWEVEELRKSLMCDVIGTEIAPTAKRYKHVFQWDFHNIKNEWKNKFDFIYSNSLDHAYDAEHCINQWLSCLNDKGKCFIQWQVRHDKSVSWNFEELVVNSGKFKINDIIVFDHPWRKFRVNLYVLQNELNGVVVQ